MQFKVLFKKNFIYWKRNYKGSIAEILVPLLLAVLMIFLRRLSTVTVATEGSSPSIPLLTSINDLDRFNTTLLRATMKDCTARSGGSIGLSPSSDITQKLATYFQKLNYTTLFFNNNQEVDDWVESDTYTDTLPDGTRKQLCLAVVFDKMDSLNYEYSLRYNLTGNPATIDHYSTNAKTYRKEFKIEDPEEYFKLLKNGIMTLQGLIDGLIFEKELSSKMNVKIRKMPNPEYTYADFTAALESPFIITLIAAALISYLRFISQIVTEREKRNIENMENMGLSKMKYFLSIYTFNLLVQFIVAIVFSVIIKGGVFKHVNFILIFFTYFMFIFVFLTIASIVSAFFIHAKKAIITGLIVFFFLFMFWILRDSLTPTSTSGTTGLALSPIGGLAQLVKIFLVFENSETLCNFPEMSYEVNSFTGSTYYIILLIEIILFFWLGIYFFYVIPLEIGIAKHPLFIFGYPWKGKGIEPFSEFDDEERNSLKNDEFPKENFENVEEELKQQSRNNQSLSIQNLTKIYSNKKLAVNNLSLEMYRDQIFALLGHNGAGKTTTISMISGFIQKNKGDIKIMGFDSINDREQIKKIMGVCPQTNPIFNYLTVAEHLELYARIKGVTGEIEAEIDEILGDIDLLHKKNYLAGNLSGGQKRKLCVAIALIGKSQVILLDEPTSGMDTYARRHLWEMLKKYKKDRIIILTTHNMDEADYLGDRIGIMSSGKLVTCGSSLFLKKRFGDGYELVVLKKTDAGENKTQLIKNLVLNLLPEATFLSEIGSEIKFRLPHQSENFHVLFQNFENKPDELGIQSFGVTLATLEDVFIKVANIKTLDKPRDQQVMNNKNNNSDLSRIMLSPEDRLQKYERIEHEIEGMDLQAMRVEKSSAIFKMQMKSLIKKRFIFFSRDKSGIICEIFLPIIIMIIGLALTKINFVNDLPALAISPSIYPNETSFYINQLVQSDGNFTSNVLGNFPIPPYKPNSISAGNISDFDKFVYANSNYSQIYAYFLESIFTNTAAYTMFFNTTAPFAPYIAVNAMNNAIFKLLSKNSNASIKMTLNPLLPTKGVKSIEDTIDGFIVVMLLALGFSFIPSSMILFIIKERENNAKHQQIISGVNIVAYWLSNFIVDYLKYLIPALVSYALFFAFDVTFFIQGERAGMSILLFVLYGIAMVGYTYVASFMFRKPSSGQVFIFLLCFFTSFVLVIVMFSLKLIVDTRDVTQNVLDYIFRLIPSFSFPYGFLMMANANLFIRVFRWPTDTGAFSPNIALNDIIYIACIGVLTYIVILIIEYWFVIMGLKKKSKVPSSLINKINDNEMKKEKEIDPDVLEEQNTVLNNLKNFSVKVSNLWKIYRVKSSSNSDGASINYKAAVKGISFGVEQGMVFSLLGTNGAGKTSTFKVLTGDISASFGEANIMGYEMPQNLIQIRHLVGYCPQFDSILENLTAQEHLELYANLKGIKPEYHEALIERMLETMNLTTYRNVKAGTYSGGNKRKLNVAIALLGRPPIVFLDEPSSGMDPEARRFMWSVINDISTKRKHSSVILTTHSMEESEALSTKIAIMVEGRIKTIGSVQQLKNKFGKGFELDIKMIIPSEQEVEATKRRIMSRVPINNYDAVVAQEIRQILQAEDLMYLDQEIAPGKKGSAILNRLELNKSVEGDLLIEWMLISKKLNKVQERITERFNAIVLETFQSYIRFKIPESNKLSEVFEYMDGTKEELEIATYSVRQISLEQIFIQFAQDIQHDN